jgi:hypothetical protein
MSTIKKLETSERDHDLRFTKASDFTKTPQERRKAPSTKIVIKYDVGFNNALFLRGEGNNLSWDKGVLLQNISPDEWMWETEAPFTSLEFKVLLNDTHYEAGENHHLSCGATIHYTPNFNI